MKRYAAFLRGVSPMNLAMPALKRALERAGFADVRTLLSSGNVVFTAEQQKPEVLEHQIEAILIDEMGRGFMTFVRPITKLRQMIDVDPYSEFRLRAGAKRVVTFLSRKLSSARLLQLELPVERAGARILALSGREVFSAYVPSASGPVFMSLLEKTFGNQITTRTWDTLKKVASCAGQSG